MSSVRCAPRLWTIPSYARIALEFAFNLIDYLSADIRTVSPDFHETYQTMRSQSDRLPTFMKTAKNRDGIVKLFAKLQ